MPFFPDELRNSRAHDYMVQVFDASLFMLFPSDYLGELIDQVLNGSSRDRLISMSSAVNTIKSIFPGRKNDYRSEWLVEPECGSGRYMLAASNHTYEYQGMSSAPMLAKAAILHN